jgi:hypothetical protein
MGRVLVLDNGIVGDDNVGHLSLFVEAKPWQHM